MLKLSIQDYEGRTTYVPLKDGEYSIGRDQANQIYLPDRNVSRQHARIRARGGQITLENVAATYGTRFNNLLVREAIEVQPGDVIEVGDYKLELVNEEKRDTAVRDTALPDPGSAARTPVAAPSGAQSKGKAPDGATAIVNLADISALLNKEPSTPSTAIPEAAQPRLVVESENLRGLELRLTKSPIVVGRVAEAADLVVDHRSISKEHARLTRLSDGTWQVLDLGSSNGIKVNGEPYSKSELRSGDRLELGHVTLRFLAAGAKASTSSAAAAPSAGGARRTLLIAGGVVLAVIALAVVAFLATGKDKSTAADAAGAGSAAGNAPEDKVVAASNGGEASAGRASADNNGADKAAAAAGAQAGAGDGGEAMLQVAQAKVDEGKYEEALPVLEAAKLQHAGSAPIAAKHAEVQKLAELKERLKKAEAKIDSDPAAALEASTEIKAAAPAGSWLRSAAEAIVESAKRRLSGKALPAKAAARDPAKAGMDSAAPAEARPAGKAEPNADTKPQAAKPEPNKVDSGKPEPKAETNKADSKGTAKSADNAKAEAPAAKSGKELYDEAREALGAQDWDRAISTAKQALKSGYRKANTVLAKAYWGKGDKANCAKYAEAAANAGFDDASIQNLLGKCQ